MGRIIHRRPRLRVRADGAPTYARGKKWPAWALLAVPFIFIMGYLYSVVREKVDWFACALTVVVFEAIMIPVEHNSIIRGHWIYNENRILGPLFWGIPIEEPLIYYLFPPVFVIMIFEITRALISGAIRLRRRGWVVRILRWISAS